MKYQKSLKINELRNKHGMTVTCINQGAAWISAKIPTSNSTREVLATCKPQDYAVQRSYLGSTIGRYSNRIKNSFLQRTKTELKKNQGQHQLHGGPAGFDKKIWEIVNENNRFLHYRLHSQDGDQGFPGNAIIDTKYYLSDQNSLTVQFYAEVDQLCPISLTNHAYFNLDKNQADARLHFLEILADYFLPVDWEGIPQNSLMKVHATSFDFNKKKRIIKDFLSDQYQKQVGGYDHAFLLKPERNTSQPVAKLYSSDEDMSLEIFTSLPAIQFYSGNSLSKTGVKNHENRNFQDFQGMALETQFLPDSPNHTGWPQTSCWFKPGKKYFSETHYVFEHQ